ncbi:MAG: sigma-70 family RNA polymerase sigma factor [Gemmatimonadetes bacterium]|nr:sigma-70 family RNA polymerase sigma factor [Gemmatimonadota bacterium]
MSTLTKTQSAVSEDRSLDLYLQEIGNVPLLMAEEETELARSVRAGDQKALEKLTASNLRFVVSVAKQYQNQGLSLSDLINEGNIGLIKAAKRFDETKGFKFISYAVWWIRQSILQALAEQSRIVRLPLSRVGTLHKIGRLSSEFEQEFGREPSTEEIAQELDMNPGDVKDTMRIASRHVSLDAPLKAGEDNRLLDLIEDDDQDAPDEALMVDSLKEEIFRALGSLTKREAAVIALYYGINMEKSHTLEEIGSRFNLTRERVRQIKEKALRRLRHVSRSQKLRAYLN